MWKRNDWWTWRTNLDKSRNFIPQVSARKSELSENRRVENQRKYRLLKKNYIILPFSLENQMNGI